jgi:drug/metabolite transporter (DMT)-like permease
MAHVNAYAAVFWRTLLAGALGLAIARVRGTLSGRELRVHARGIVLGGALLGAHFVLWVKAFELTDYASNLLLLVAQPLIAALVGARLGEPLPRHATVALTLAGAGMVLIGGGDFAMGRRALLGDAMCVVAGGFITFFYVAARDARKTLPLDAFMGATMLAASLAALPVALVTGAPLSGFPPASWAWIAGIVLFTTLFGHGLLNFAAKSVSLFTVNLVIVLEPVIAIAMGAALFGARITLVQCLGGTLLGGAVLVGMRQPSGRASPPVVVPSG